MSKQAFTLISLKDEEAQKLTGVLSSLTCRKILNYLADKRDATETEISEKLSIPLSTVHYNIKQLLKTKLIRADEYHYSKRGKEINHYSIANKYIIIAPKITEGLAARLKKALPPFVIAFAAASLMKIFSWIFAGRIGMFGTYTGGIQTLGDDHSLGQMIFTSSTAWFIYGILFAFVVYVIYEVIRSKVKK